MNTLAAHLERLDASLATLPNVPPWTGHLIVEEGHVVPDEVGYVLVAPEAPQSVAKYAARFSALLEAGYAWINLNAIGVADGRLLVGVELPRSVTGVAPSGTSVNLSGPIRAVREREGWTLRLKYGET